MPIFYKRTENEKSINIIFKYRYTHLAIILIIGLFFYKFFPELEGSLTEKIVSGGLLLSFLYHIVERIKPTREVQRAMKKDGVKMSGSLYSFKNPVKFEITK